MKSKLKAMAVLAGILSLNVSVLAADAKTDQKPPDQKGTRPFKNVKVAEFEKLRADKQNIVLDVRTQKEFEIGHIPGAINIDVNKPDFQDKVSHLDKKKTYLVHCAAGGRSARACDKMRGLEFSRLYNLEGGFSAWEQAGNKAGK